MRSRPLAALLAAAVVASSVVAGSALAGPAQAATGTDVVTRVAGSLTGTDENNGPALDYWLEDIEGVGVDANGNVYFGSNHYDPDNNGVALKVDKTGILTKIAGTGTPGANIPGPALDRPIGYVMDVQPGPDGAIYVADSDNYSVLRIADGQLSVYAGDGTAGDPVAGAATSSPMAAPNGIAFDPAGNLYIATNGASNCYLLKVTPAGQLSKIAGNGGCQQPVVEGPALSTPFGSPQKVAVDSQGNVYMSDSSFGTTRVVKITPSGDLSFVAGNGTAGPLAPGPALSSPINGGYGIAIDQADNLYVTGGNTNEIGKVDTSGNLSVIAGDGTETLPTWGTEAAATSMPGPIGLAVDPIGNLFVATFPASVPVTVIKLSPATPSAPTDPHALADDKAVTLTWKEPVSFGSTQLTGYTVKAYLNDVEVPGATCQTTALTCTVTGLTNGKTYTFRIEAANSAGAGPSAAVTGTPSGSAPPPPPVPGQYELTIAAGAVKGKVPNKTVNLHGEARKAKQKVWIYRASKSGGAATLVGSVWSKNHQWKRKAVSFGGASTAYFCARAGLRFSDTIRVPALRSGPAVRGDVIRCPRIARNS